MNIEEVNKNACKGVSNLKKDDLSDNDDGFVILVAMDASTSSLPGKFDGMRDSMESSNSSLLEKQTSEDSEKPRGSNSVGNNPLAITSRIIGEQEKIINKRGYFRDGEKENEEKIDKPYGEKPHVEDLPVSSQKAIEDVGEKSSKRENPPTLPEGRGVPRSEEVSFTSTSGESGLGESGNEEGASLDGCKPSDMNDGKKTDDGEGVQSGSDVYSGTRVERNEPAAGSHENVVAGVAERGQSSRITEKDSLIHNGDDMATSINDSCINEDEDIDHTVPSDNRKPDDIPGDEYQVKEIQEAGSLERKTDCNTDTVGDVHPKSSDEETSGLNVKEQDGDSDGDEMKACLNDSVQNDSARSDSAQDDSAQDDSAQNDSAQDDSAQDDSAQNDSAQNDSAQNDSDSDEGEREQTSFQGTGGETDFTQDARGTRIRHKRHLPPARQHSIKDNPENQPYGMDESPKSNGRGFCCTVTIFVILFISIFIALFPPMSPDKPFVEINTAKHVAPTSASWQLRGSCRGYNSSYNITQCQWKQIHPKPTKPENTIIPVTQDCLRGNSSYKIDASLGMRVPEDLGNYIFELHCTDDTGNTNDERVNVWINTLIPPIIKDTEENIVISASIGSTRLKASCLAVQGTIESEKWTFIDGPKNLDDPARDGIIEIDVPGKYEFKFKCLDSYGGNSSVDVNVIAKPPYVLGIDLGTSTTCIVVILENGTTRDINVYYDQNDTDSCMPSVVAFAENGTLLIGEEALRQAVTNPLSTIYEVKRLMGRSYYDVSSHKFSYKVRPTLASHSLKGVRAAIEIPCNGEKKLLQPELVSALILRRVIDLAEKYLKVPVKDVVISVPAQFDNAQRKATMDAGRIAGLSPRKIVNEPTVAAFAARNVMDSWLNPDQDPGVKKNQGTVYAVVADIGGGTTDYALMQIDAAKNAYKVITTDGNKILGGRDIDIALAKKVTEILQNKHREIDLGSIEFQQQLRIKCEYAKIVLSDNEQYSMTLDYSDVKHGNLRLEHMMTRDAFESYISKILEEMVAPLDSLLARSRGVNLISIKELYLVGGTSKIPKLKELLRKYFSKLKRVLHDDPIQLVSRGAAVFGAALTHLVEVQNMPEIDVTPLPIKIAVDMDAMEEIFPRNTIYPTYASRTVTTFTDQQTSIIVKVYEGEGSTASENHFLGELELSGIPPHPKGQPKIVTTYTIDTHGILSVTAAHAGGVVRKNLDVYTKSGSMREKTKTKLSSLLKKLMSDDASYQCSLLQTATEMNSIPSEPKEQNVLKLFVDSEYDSVVMTDKPKPTVMGMIALKGMVTGSKTETKGTDMDIILVIDKSGSMVGMPIDAIRKVILGFLNVLKDNHRLGIVSYDNYVHTHLELTHCTEEYKIRARNIFMAIEADGGTNLYGGLLTGLKMAYHGARRSRVLLFTDGFANVGLSNADDIIKGISREIANLKKSTSVEVQLSTFGYRGNHDEGLLKGLATNVGGGKYSFLDENTDMVKILGLFLGDAINTISEKIQLTVTPLDGVQIMKVTSEFCKKDHAKMTCEIPSLADQHSLHVLFELSVPPCDQEKAHDALLHADLSYTNARTNGLEGSEDRLFVARTARLDEETRSRVVNEQLNRISVAEEIGKALDYLKTNNKEQAKRLLKEADESILASISKDCTLSLCLHRDLISLISLVEGGDVNDARKALQDSWTSHLQEKGGSKTCYLTKQEDQLITIMKN